MTKKVFFNTIYCVISIKILVYFSYEKGIVCECIIQSLILLKRKSERDKIGRGRDNKKEMGDIIVMPFIWPIWHLGAAYIGLCLSSLLAY